jgi:phosphoribosyl-ATP pyrophosphohydrolase/phosphoribosyl-AMP cyclohydrolase
MSVSNDSDRALRSAADLDRVDFAKGEGLVPVVAQEGTGGRVLMVAWANRPALERSLETGEMHFWSRSRGELWRKGETSGNVLGLVSLHSDCDGDTVLARVAPSGPACHTGEESCFGAGTAPRSADGLGGALDTLDATLAHRQRERPEGSYTVRLLDDENLRLKKLGEETAELLVALARKDTGRIPEEAADLLYHLLAALRAADVEPDSVARALEARRG